MSKHFTMTLCEQNIFGRTTCLTLTAKVKVGAAECQDMLGCVELNVDLSVGQGLGTMSCGAGSKGRCLESVNAQK